MSPDNITALRPPFLPARIAIWWMTVMVASGWLLSAIHGLNFLGQTFAVLIAIAGTVWLCRAQRHAGRTELPCLRLHAWRRRSRRFLPAAFLAMAALVTLSALLHPPNNYDALSYRIPRLFHWLSEERWHWIAGADPRWNTRVTGIEWVWAAIVRFTAGDRWLPATNLAAFLMLPGLVFGVFTRLGVSPRLAWQWMWLLPSGYCFLLQTGGVGNDGFAAALALGGLALALEASRTRRLGDLWLALLAGSLLTAVKTSNLPLLLPIAVAALPALKETLRRPLATAAVLLVAAAISFLPTAYLNWRQCGDWTGYVLENQGVIAVSKDSATGTNAPAKGKVFRVRDPLVGLAGNTVNAAVQNLAPPIFPQAARWNAAVKTAMPEKLHTLVFDNFEGDFLRLGELQTEAAGLGIGLWSLVIISLLHRIRQPSVAKIGWHQRALLWAPYVSLGYLFTECGVGQISRLIAPYYPLLLPLLLAGTPPSSLKASAVWRWGQRSVIAVAFVVLTILPERPLWPASRILDSLIQRFPNHAKLERARNVYSTYADRSDAFRLARDLIPADTKTVGFLGTDDEPVAPLWRPFGTRRVVHLLPDTTREALERAGIRHIVASENGSEYLFGETVDGWCRRMNAEIVSTVTITLKVSRGPERWHLVRLK